MTIKQIKYIFILILIVSLSSCTKKINSYSVYEYPLDSLKGTTVFRWHNYIDDTIEVSYTCKKIIVDPQDSLLIEYSYTDKYLMDSSIYNIKNGEINLIEKWRNVADSSQKNIRVKSSQIKTKNSYWKVVYPSDILGGLLNYVQKVTVDYGIPGKDTITFVSDIHISARIKLLNIGIFNNKSTIEGIMKKNIGAVEYKGLIGEKPFLSKLDTIYHK